MAARNAPLDGRAWTPEKVRARIKTALLINALQDHVLNDRPMSKTQKDAAVALLKKTVPDLQSVALTGEDGTGPVKLELVGSDVDG